MSFLVYQLSALRRIYTSHAYFEAVDFLQVLYNSSALKTKVHAPDDIFSDTMLSGQPKIN